MSSKIDSLPTIKSFLSESFLVEKYQGDVNGVLDK